MTLGRDTRTSNPSRRIVSTRTEISIAPRAETLKNPASSPSETWRETLVFSSRSRRSRIAREVTCFPSLPAKGPSFTANCICTVGGSILMIGRASIDSDPTIVSPMSTSSNPARPIMFPAEPSSASVVPILEYSRILETVLLTRVPSLRQSQIESPFLMVPDWILPSAIRPM